MFSPNLLGPAGLWQGWSEAAVAGAIEEARRFHPLRRWWMRLLAWPARRLYARDWAEVARRLPRKG